MKPPAEPPHYTIRTVNDFLAIPADRLAACLEDLASAIEIHRAAAGLVRAVAEGLRQGVSIPDDAFTMPCFTWIDDGERNATVIMRTNRDDKSGENQDQETDRP